MFGSSTHRAFLCLLLAGSCCVRSSSAADVPTAANKPVALPATPVAAPSVPGPAATTAPAPPAKPEPAPPQEALPLGRGAASSLAPGAPNTETEPASSRSWLLQTFTALAVVIGLIYLLRLFLQKITGTGPLPGGQKLVEVLARSNIAPKTQVLFLRINQRIVVVGQTPAGLSNLTTLDDPQDVAWLLAQVQAARPLSVTQGFKQLLHRFDGDYDPAAPEVTQHNDPEQFVDRTRNQLSSLLTRIRTMKGKPPGSEDAP
jgi:flagellar biogenesis protein FliO